MEKILLEKCRSTKSCLFSYNLGKGKCRVGEKVKNVPLEVECDSKKA